MSGHQTIIYVNKKNPRSMGSFGLRNLEHIDYEFDDKTRSSQEKILVFYELPRDVLDLVRLGSFNSIDGMEYIVMSTPDPRLYRDALWPPSKVCIRYYGYIINDKNHTGYVFVHSFKQHEMTIADAQYIRDVLDKSNKKEFLAIAHTVCHMVHGTTLQKLAELFGEKSIVDKTCYIDKSYEAHFSAIDDKYNVLSSEFDLSEKIEDHSMKIIFIISFPLGSGENSAKRLRCILNNLHRYVKLGGMIVINNAKMILRLRYNKEGELTCPKILDSSLIVDGYTINDEMTKSLSSSMRKPSLVVYNAAITDTIEKITEVD